MAALETRKSPMRLTALLASAALFAAAGVADAQQTASQILAANRAASHGDALAGKGTLKIAFAYDGEGMARCPHFSIPWPDLRIFFAVASTFAAAVGRKMIK